MKKITLAASAVVIWLVAAPAGAEAPDDGYQAFEVTRSVARRGVSLAAFDVVGAPLSINAYGRKARARLFDAMAETRDLRRQAAAFDESARPALLTLEMRLHF
jgi:hypothetical protein